MTPNASAAAKKKKSRHADTHKTKQYYIACCRHEYSLVGWTLYHRYSPTTTTRAPQRYAAPHEAAVDNADSRGCLREAV